MAPDRPIERICSGSFDILGKSSNDISRTWIRATSNVCCRRISDYHDCICTNLVSGLGHFVGTEKPLADLRTSNNRHKERPQTPIPSCNDEYIVVHNQKHTNCYSCNLLHNGPRFYYQGKCSVIKALDLRVPPKPTRLKRVTNDDIYFPSGVLRRKRRTQSDPSKIWRKELKESLKTPFSFNENEMVDENQEDNERQVNIFLTCNLFILCISIYKWIGYRRYS